MLNVNNYFQVTIYYHTIKKLNNQYNIPFISIPLTNFAMSLQQFLSSPKFALSCRNKSHDTHPQTNFCYHINFKTEGSSLVTSSGHHEIILYTTNNLNTIMEQTTITVKEFLDLMVQIIGDFDYTKPNGLRTTIRQSWEQFSVNYEKDPTEINKHMSQVIGDFLTTKNIIPPASKSRSLYCIDGRTTRLFDTINQFINANKFDNNEVIVCEIIFCQKSFVFMAVFE